MKNIGKQFDDCMNNIFNQMHLFILPQMVDFGIRMVNEVIPSQQEFRNLTGNTLTSYAFGVYHNGKLEIAGFNKTAEPAWRNKLIAGETISNFKDYDGKHRTYFTAEVDTDGDLGKNTSWNFLNSYTPKGKYSIIFTTGTEYSAYLENILHLNVLTESFEESKSIFQKSFKVIDLSVRQ